MSNTTELKRRRTSVKAKATRFKNFIEGFDSSSDSIYELESRIERLDELWSEFDRVQDGKA